MSRPSVPLIVAAHFALLFAARPVPAQEIEWPSGFHRPGVSIGTQAAAVYDLEPFVGSNGPELAVAGAFRSIGSERIVGLARWNGTQWSSIGRLYGAAFYLTKYDSGQGPLLIAAGSFTRAGLLTVPGIAAWNGSAWSQLAGTTGAQPATIGGMSTFADATGQGLYVWGTFQNLFGTGIRFVARWDGSQWSGFGPGPAEPVWFLTVHDDGTGAKPYIWNGGQVLRWNGTTWTPIGSLSPTQRASVLSFDDGAGPTLWSAGSFVGTSLSRWTGGVWSAAPSPPTGAAIYNLRVHGMGGPPSLFATTGLWTGAEYRFELARFDSSSWTTIGGEIGPSWAYPFTSADVGNGRRTFIGGDFAFAGDAHAGGIAELDNGNWRALGTGLGVSGYGIDCLLEHDDGTGRALYAGGRIFGAGAVKARHVARWNGTRWERVGDGPGARVTALAEYDDGTGLALFAGHDMGVAKWNGTTWTQIAGVAPTNVRAFCVYDSGQGPELVAAGGFNQIAGTPALGLAAWNGTAWRQLGQGLTWAPYSLVVFDEGAGPRLYIGGDGGIGAGPSSCIVRWDGTSLSSVGPPNTEWVRSLVVHDDGNGPALYAGGALGSSLGLARVLRFRNGTWVPVGGEFGGWGTLPIRALASAPTPSGRVLYCAGVFLDVGGVQAKFVARWSGAEWQPLGAGVELDNGSGVFALAPFDFGSQPALCIGGNFGEAGGNIAEDFAIVLDRTRPLNAFCSGDGSASACPCGNFGAPAHGCRSMSRPEGAQLTDLGNASVSNDTLRFEASGLPLVSVLAHFLQGTLRANGGFGVPVFDGLACLDGSVLRLATKYSSAGVAIYPESFDRPVSIEGAVPPLGGTRHYQVQYRDTYAGYCSPAAENWSNGLSVVWLP